MCTEGILRPWFLLLLLLLLLWLRLLLVGSALITEGLAALIVVR
jgi:hypothetical protein